MHEKLKNAKESFIVEFAVLFRVFTPFPQANNNAGKVSLRQFFDFSLGKIADVGKTLVNELGQDLLGALALFGIEELG